mmetsp:Transcript_3104/g.8949  ORF Transcript_3104/g.8949 Transcript_3104/m.8949 type:complete len:308 (+) Transcript_3104:197-1120(+)
MNRPRPKRSRSCIALLSLVAALVATASSEETCTQGRVATNACEKRSLVHNNWRWVPQAQHRCNITRISREEFHATFGPSGLPKLHPYPLVIYDEYSDADNEPRRNAIFVEKTTFENLPSCFPPEFNVTLSSSNSISAHRRTIPLVQYLEEITTIANGETYPDQLSNETWYLFGETYGVEWKRMLLDYEMPPCSTCEDRELSALAFGVGNCGSGVQWHTHGPGFSESIHGQKHWVLYPPERKPSYNSDYASRYWMETNYMDIENEDDMPWECTLNPGDLVYFPDQWHHATINLSPYTVFVSTFTTEHI